MGNNPYDFLLRCAAVVGIPFRAFLRGIRNQDSNLLVLLYHDVTENQFREHMLFLEKYFNFADINELVRKVEARTFPSDLTAVITFDDGLRSFYHNAFPVVDELGIPVTIYVSSGVVDSEFWLKKRLNRQVLPPISKPNGSKGANTYSRNQARSYGFEILPGLRLEELRSIDKHKNVIVGSHSISHRMLPETSYHDCKKEILDSKEQLESMLNHRVDHFAYPYGGYGNREKELVMKAGFTSAAAVDDQWISHDSDVFCLPRKGTGPLGSSVPWLQYRIGK